MLSSPTAVSGTVCVCVDLWMHQDMRAQHREHILQIDNTFYVHLHIWMHQDMLSRNLGGFLAKHVPVKHTGSLW
jgi:hypothetical protein